jgi:hypothetical protein
MEILELNRHLENPATAFLWLAASKAKEVRFNCFSGAFASQIEKQQMTVDFVATCTDRNPSVDNLYKLSFAVPISKLVLKVSKAGTPLFEVQTLLDFTKVETMTREVIFKTPFPLSTFRLHLFYIFNSGLNPSLRFDYETLTEQKYLAPYYEVAVLDVNTRDSTRIEIEKEPSIDIEMQVTDSCKNSISHSQTLNTR